MAEAARAAAPLAPGQCPASWELLSWGEKLPNLIPPAFANVLPHKTKRDNPPGRQAGAYSPGPPQ